MLNPKKIVVAIVISLLILPGLLFQLPSVSAHNDTFVHPYMSEESANLLPEGSEMRIEISNYMDRIKAGSYDEDHTDHVYSHLTHNLYGIVSIPHFWDADKDPPEDRVKNIFGEEDMFPNAYQKSLELFRMAYDEYPTDRDQAYEYLGHVAHLIQDMTVPAHVHEDWHVGVWEPLAILGSGDDSFEDWYYDSGEYVHYTAVSALAAGGLITFPDDVEEEMRQGNWTAGLYYLMYTTNQYADYFASDDEDGDTFDKEGWMDYSGWPDRPTEASQLEDNDRYWNWLLMMYLDDDNDEDGQLSTIASKTCVYGIRAMATLYKMFYEATHPPQASITIVDYDGNGIADYRWVKLDLEYDVGADEYFRDLEASFRNEDGVWTSWEPVGAVAGGRRKTWILSEEDGTKTVSYQVRNLMGRNTTVSDTIELVEKGMPQTFEYTITATGAANQPLTAQVEFVLDMIWVKHNKGDWDGTVEFYFDPIWVDDGAGNAHTEKARIPDNYWEIDPDHDYGYGGKGIKAMGPLEMYSINVLTGTDVRLRAKGWDQDPPDDLMYTIVTDTYSVPDVEGMSWLADGWFYEKGDGTINPDFALNVWIFSTVDYIPWSRSESGEWIVEYGKTPGVNSDNYVTSSTSLAPADEVEPFPHTTKWEASIDNTAIEYEMVDERLYTWTTGEPEMVVAAFSPVDLLITDPDGRKIGVWAYIKEAVIDPDIGLVYIWVPLITNEIPGASVLQKDLNGDGDLDFVIVFDDKAVGDYQIHASGIRADPTDTYSIGISSPWLGLPLDPTKPVTPPDRTAFLVEDALVAEMPAEPYVVQSTDSTINLPPSADANGPYMASEGTAVNFDASGSTDPDGDSLTYRWDFEDDGTWDTGWSSSPTASHTWQDDWTGTARVEVSDGTFTDNSTATVTVSNVAPTVNAGPNQLVAPGEEVHFSGSFTDPGVLDTHTIEWDFGDGTTATNTLTPTHSYSEAKKHTVTLTVTDDDGGVGIDTLAVNTGVEVSIDPLMAFVPPGGSTTYNVLTHHLGNTEDTYSLQLSGLDATWYSLSTTSVPLDPDQSESVTLTVSPPDTATIRSYEFTVVAASQTDPTVLDTADADAIVFTALATIESCDSTGEKKDTFDIPEDVYVNGSGYSPSTTYDVYIVEDVTTWTDGMAIPSRVPGTATSVSSDASGNIPATLVWSDPLVPGKYDIVVDIDSDGFYNQTRDALDDGDIKVTAGFHVIPEVPFGTIVASAAMIIALVAYVAVPKWRRKREHVNL